MKYSIRHFSRRFRHSGVMLLLSLATGSPALFAQAEAFTAVRAEVDFSEHIREWDGFGFNYVETAQTTDYEQDPQEYGGFSLLSEEEKSEILDMVFGEEGLKVAIVKMFYDPFHQAAPGGPFDHESTTRYMREFVRRGLEITRARGGDLQIITTLYGPPAWATVINKIRGRDLDPTRKRDVANYLIDWVKFLREEEGFPVGWISLHNEGEDWMRWPAHGQDPNIGHGHDYNLFWPPEQVVDFLRFMRPMMDEAGLVAVGLTPGETTNWTRFHHWGYAHAIAADEVALRNLGLITSHGFYNGTYGRWYGDHRSVGTDMLRDERPELHAWVTSSSWAQMDADFVMQIYGSIYVAKVNAFIPWSGIQRPPLWVGGDPNPGTAFRVYEDGSYEVMRGYYFYKQVARAGQPGMAVAHTTAMDSEIGVLGWASNGTANPDAVAVVNRSAEQKRIHLEISGTNASAFSAFRTTDDEARYEAIGVLALREGAISLQLPPRSVTTLFAE